MTRIAIMGTGRMARQLGLGWARTGHQVRLGSRTPLHRREQIPSAAGLGLAGIPEALAVAEVVVLAQPYSAVAAFAREHARALRERVVVDISNPFEHLPDNRIAGAEITAAAIGPGARVVAAFKANFWETILEPVDPVSGHVRDVHLAGDDEAAKQLVAQLVADLGFQPVDCGALRNARVLDAMVPLIVELDRRYAGAVHRCSWKLLS